MDINNLLAVARSVVPADLVLKNARIVNTFTAEIEEANIAIVDGLIAGVGDYRDGNEVIDLQSKYVCPGLIDGHVHMENSHLIPAEYAKIAVPRGMLALVTDFHEIANVCGLAGIHYILNNAASLPLDIFGMIPSCVPATRLETAGARLDAEDIKEIMDLPNMIGLGEVMNFPSVIYGNASIWDKIELFRDRVIDGHSPGLYGNKLNAYVSAGITSDHECSTVEEAKEKLNRGMYIMIREGSAGKNLEALLALVTDRTFKRCFFVTDDRNCSDLLNDGNIDAVVRKAIALGLEPVRAIQMATINTAEYFGLSGLGAIAPGNRANMVVLGDLTRMKAEMVFFNGELVAQDGRITFDVAAATDDRLFRTVNIKPFELGALSMRTRHDTFPVIEIVTDQITTRKVREYVKVEDGIIQPDIERDILKLVVVERHHATGNIGLGLVNGFGLKKGAIASSVAHDSHNIVVVGTNDRDIFVAVKELERLQGGIMIASEGQILESLPLPVAGILSEEPVEAVVEKFAELKVIADSLGCKLSAPFDTLSFLALPVVPELRLTDLGLVDVPEFKLIREEDLYGN